MWRSGNQACVEDEEVFIKSTIVVGFPLDGDQEHYARKRRVRTRIDYLGLVASPVQSMAAACLWLVSASPAAY